MSKEHEDANKTGTNGEVHTSTAECCPNLHNSSQEKTYNTDSSRCKLQQSQFATIWRHYSGKHREVTLNNSRHGQKGEKQPGNCANTQQPNTQKQTKAEMILHVDDIKTKKPTQKQTKLMEPKKIPHKCFLLQNNLIKTWIQ